MSTRKPEDNLWFDVFGLVSGFFRGLWGTLWLIWNSLIWRKVANDRSPNHFLESLHFLIHEFPKSFWKFPTGIGIGRSIGTLVLFFFGKRWYFNPEKSTDNASSHERINRSGFTLVEMLLTITLFSAILVAAFDSLGMIWQLKNRIIGDVDVYEQLYVAVENLGTLIKDGGDIDYEEYFNRSLVGTSLSGWHYALPSGFGNFWEFGALSPIPSFWSGAYYCRSGVGLRITDTWCSLTWATNTTWNSQSGTMQRYGQYRLQFWDYNGGGSNDTTRCTGRWIPGMPLGDADCDGKITGDLDDEELWLGPVAFPEGQPLNELYLIKKGGSNPTRLAIRLKIEQDPDAPIGAVCDTQSWTGSWCIGRLQMLRLIGRDLWINHGVAPTPPVFDWAIDTWECLPEFPCTTLTWAFLGWIQRYLPSWDDGEWVDIFSRDIHVASAYFYLSPNIDYSLAWKDNPDRLANSYLRMNLSLWYSWKKRKLMRQSSPEITISTTINLRK